MNFKQGKLIDGVFEIPKGTEVELTEFLNPHTGDITWLLNYVDDVVTNSSLSIELLLEDVDYIKSIIG